MTSDLTDPIKTELPEKSGVFPVPSMLLPPNPHRPGETSLDLGNKVSSVEKCKERR